jgi:hypothetical protein
MNHLVVAALIFAGAMGLIVISIPAIVITVVIGKFDIKQIIRFYIFLWGL